MLERHVAVDQAMVRIHHFVIVRERLRLIALSDGRRLQGRSGLPFTAVVVLQHPVFHTGSGCACVELGVDDRSGLYGHFRNGEQPPVARPSARDIRLAGRIGTGYLVVYVERRIAVADIADIALSADSKEFPVRSSSRRRRRTDPLRQP